MKPKSPNAVAYCAIVVIAVVSADRIAVAGGSACANGSQVKVCVQWSQTSNPEPDVDFQVTFTDASSPSVELLRGDLGWVVSAELVSNGAPANIASITTPAADNFVVKIAKGTGAGAANVGSITLQPTGSYYSSVASGSHISGNLTGNLTVLRSSTTGGEVTLAVDGNVASTSTITVPVLKSLNIAGDLAGDIIVTSKMDDGALQVAGSVANGSVIDIADMVGNSSVIFTKTFGASTFSGRLVLRTGVKSGQYLTIACPMTSTGVIDFNGADIAGTTWVEVAAGTVVGGGVVRANVTIASQFDLTGSVTVSGVANASNLNWECPTGVYMNGSIHVTGDVLGPDGAVGAHSGVMQSSAQIAINGNLAGTVRTSAAGDGGNCPGAISIGGNVSGKVETNGDLSGSVDITGYLSGDVKITGNTSGPIHLIQKLTSTGRILIDGLCNGAIKIGQETESLSIIRAIGGLGSSGAIRINDSRGDFDARGNMHFGSTSSILPTPPPSVTFDGSIKILRNSGNTDGGDLIGGITVIGCHATTDPLDICICGTNSGRVSITQTSCSNQASWSCVTGCN